MRYRWLSLAALVAGSALALGHQPPNQWGNQPPAQFGPQTQPQITLDPTNNRLDWLLVNWERVMSGLNSLQTNVTRTAKDKVYLSVDSYSGWAKYIKPNKASLYLKSTSKDPKKQQEFEYLVCNGQTAFKWEPTTKEIHGYQLPKPKQGQINDDNFVGLLFGMKAIDAKRRYDLRLPDPPNDATYHYIWIFPRDPQDRAEFAKARLCLLTKNFLPAQIYYEQPNGNEMEYGFTNTVPDAPIDAREFNQPRDEGGWKLKWVALQEGPPRIIRYQDGK